MTGPPAPTGYITKAAELGAVWVHGNDVSTTTWSDDSGNEHDGVLVNTPLWHADGGPGSALPGHMQFNHTAQSYVTMGHHEDFNVQAHTIGAWVRGPFVGVDWIGLIGKGDGSFQLRRQRSGDYSLRYDVRGPGTDDQVHIEVNDALSDEWEFVVARYDGHIMQILRVDNGQLVVLAEDARVGMVQENNLQLLYAAQNPSGATIRRYPSVRMAGPFGFARALSDEELIEMYNATFEAN